jgi:hypothetical protein
LAALHIGGRIRGVTEVNAKQEKSETQQHSPLLNQVSPLGNERQKPVLEMFKNVIETRIARQILLVGEL